jgi:uncharacterized protein (DUF58 family)
MKATREGKRFVLASVLIVVAALNTGNNLIYLILALMLSLVVVSLGILKENLSGLSLTVDSISAVFAGEEAPFSLTLRNCKRYIPTYSVNILSEGLTSRSYFPIVPARGETVMEVKIVFRKRGLYDARSFTAQSGFPFILFVGERRMEVAKEVLVYPALRDVGDIVSEGWGAAVGDTARIAGAGEEIRSIRDFRYGDDSRHIHWKASAKVADLMVKEYAENELRRTTIILDNMRTGALGNQRHGDEVFEKAVSLTASFAKHFIEVGHLVRVVSSRKVIPFGSGAEQLFKILDILATISEEDIWESPLPAEGEGMIISILLTPQPAVEGLMAMSRLVVHAETL